MDVQAWTGPTTGQALRRAARLADRVLVVVTSGGISAIELANVPRLIEREYAIGYAVVATSDDYLNLIDRVGPVEEFWLGPDA